MPESGQPIGQTRHGLARIVARAASVFILILVGTWLLPAGETASPATQSEGFLLHLAILFVALLGGSGLISSSETALFSLDKLDLSQLKNSRHMTDRIIVYLLDRPNDTLVTILIINNFLNVAISLTAGAFMDTLFKGISPAAFALAAFIATTGILLFGEIIPKIIAHLKPRSTARLLAMPLVGVHWLLNPLRIVLGFILRRLFHLLKIPEHSADEVSEEELKMMISSGEVSQVLQEDEREMIDGVFDLRHTVVAEILTPRMSAQALPDNLTQEEMVARLREMDHNRVPVYKETMDDVLGFLLAKEVLLDEKGCWRDHLRKALCVPERIGLLDLLRMFRDEHTKFAVVVDEYGGVAGIVTLQDLLEEIVGDIYEKHEHNDQEIEPLGENHWRISGQTNLDVIHEQLNVQLPSHKGRTLGGFVMNTLGHIPAVGEELQEPPLHFRVEKMAGRRVFSLIVTRGDEPGNACGGHGEDAS